MTVHPVGAATSLLDITSVCSATAQLTFSPELRLLPALSMPLGTTAGTYTMTGLAVCTLGTPEAFQWVASGPVDAGASCGAFAAGANGVIISGTFGTPTAAVTVVGVGPAEVTYFQGMGASDMFQAAGPFAWTNTQQIDACVAQGGTASITLNGYLAVID